jgi:hypothetical protein
MIQSFFEEFSANQMLLSSATAMAWQPTVTPATRPSFEDFALQNLNIIASNYSSSAEPIVAEGIRTELTFVPYPTNATGGPFLPGIFVPVLQIAPIAELWNFLLVDVASNAVMADAIDIAAQDGVPACSSILYVVPAEGTEKTSSAIFAPVYSLFFASEVIGYTSAEFSWDDLIQSAVPQGVELWAVISPADSMDQYTFYISNGMVRNMGPGNQAITSISSSLQAWQRTATITVGQAITFTVYPATEMENDYYSQLPSHLTIAAVISIVVVAAVYLGYDHLSNQRTKFMTEIAQSTETMLDTLRTLNEPHDFVAELRKLQCYGPRAREINRSQVQLHHQIGQGEFGNVYKVGTYKNHTRSAHTGRARYIHHKPSTPSRSRSSPVRMSLRRPKFSTKPPRWPSFHTSAAFHWCV